MALTIDRLTPMRLMKIPLYYPLTMGDKLRKSAVFVLTKNIDDTIKFLNKNEFLINNNYFASYYTERNFDFVMNESANAERNPRIQNILESTNGEKDPFINDYYIQTKDHKYFYPDAVEKIIFSEDFGITQNYRNIFRTLLYSERIKNQKDLFAIYDKIKAKIPWIKHTYLNYALYRQRNLIVDWSYYTNAFLKNNFYKLDRGIDIFHHFLTKFIMDRRLEEAGYVRKTIFIPVDSWRTPGAKIYDFHQDINPISMIYRLIKMRNSMYDDWKGVDFIFCSEKAYFKVDWNDFDNTDLTRFVTFIDKLLANAIYDAGDELVVNRFSDDKPSDSSDDKEYDPDSSPDTNIQIGEDEPTSSDDEELENIQRAMQNLDQEPTSTEKISQSRKDRLEKLNKEFDESEIDGIKVKDIIQNYYNKNEELKKDTIPVDSLNKEWQDVTFTNFGKEYNITDDVVAILKEFTTKSKPISIVKVEKVDNSNYEDYIDTLSITTEDAYGNRSTVKLDIPKFINHRFMKLRGNLKTINGQLILMPIIKTGRDTSQIVSSYNKIFIYRINPSNGTKSTKAVNKLTKALSKYDGTNISIFTGDNTLIASKYDLPIEYEDLCSLYSRIDCKDKSYITFDIDYATKNLEVMADKNYNKDTDVIVGFDYPTSKVIYCKAQEVAKTIGEFLASKDKDFADIYDASKPSNKLSYTSASILSTRIPVIVVMAFSDGLEKAMKKAHIKYEFVEKRPKLDDDHSLIKLSDGYILYEDSKPEDSLLMSGLAQCDLSEYSLANINNKSTWLEVLDDFGGRLRADGLDNFHDLMFDPITIDICKRNNLPYDYVEALGYASALLADTKYNKHTDITGNRIRTNELISAYLYKVLAKGYGDYANKVRHMGGKGAKLNIPQNALINAIMADPGLSDLSVLNPLLEAEAANKLSFKGLSGMNSDRSYTLDKRIYDKSMLGVLGMSTGFSETVGVNRQATINSSIKDTRGTIDPKKENQLNTLNTLTIYEGLTPYGTTHDDPIRTAMGFTQTTQHQMRVKHSSPNLITYGMDEALPYMTTNIFSYKFKGKKGKVLDVTDDYIIFEEIDNDGKKSTHMINLKEQVMKNSDGGFFVTVKLKGMVKKGYNLKYNDILAYDSSAYTKSLATSKSQKNISYNIGTLAKVAIMCTDEAYEDSSIIDERLSDALTSSYCVKVNKTLSAGANAYYIAKVGQELKEGESLLVFQDNLNDAAANAILRNMDDDKTEEINDFYRTKIKSKLTGVLQDIRIYRTCDISDLSPSLKRIVVDYESNIKKEKDIAKKYGISEDEIKTNIEPDYKLEQSGKLKAVENGVLIEFYIKCYDKMGIGDKLTYNTAIKGVVKDIMPEGKEPYTDFRPNEKVDALLTSASVNARMVSSIITAGSLTKVLVELTRTCKDALGIEWEYLNNDDKK